MIVEWDFEKNSELGLEFHKLTKFSNKRAWWICPKCSSSYDMTITGRAKNNCPYCRGYRVSHRNSLASLNPALASEWHPTKNGEWTPDDVVQFSNKKAWWLGTCGHEWEANISNRSNHGKGCPYCAGQKLLVGFNDMWTTNPELASMLANPDDGYTYMQNTSTKRLDWKCRCCGELVSNKTPYAFKISSRLCTGCSKGNSYPERLLYNVLRQLNLQVASQKIFSWSKRKRYDFYIDSLNMIIEVHGIQHYSEKFQFGDTESNLAYQLKNDEMKLELATSNSIDKYIVINASKVNVEYLKDNIIEALSPFIPNINKVDWNKANHSAVLPTATLIEELWEDKKDLYYISKEMGIAKSTIQKYLREISKIKDIGYRETCKENVVKSRAKPIGKFDSNGELIKSWISVAEAGRDEKLQVSTLGEKARDNGEYKGFTWRFIEEENNV